MSKIGKVLVWGDNHFPYHDVAAHDAIYEFTEDYQPNYHVLIGDCLNLGGISRHVQDDLIAKYEEPVIAGLLTMGAHITTLRKLNPKAEIIWIWGNHDNRLRRFVHAEPSWRGIIDDPLGLVEYFGKCVEAPDVRLVHLDYPEDDFSIGRLSFCHGFSTCKHVAAKHVEDYGHSVMFGHSHTQQSFTTVRRGEPSAGYCVGHLMDRGGYKYLMGKPTRWVTGFAYVDFIRDTGEFFPHLIPIIRGRFVYAEKIYGKKTKTRAKRVTLKP